MITASNGDFEIEEITQGIASLKNISNDIIDRVIAESPIAHCTASSSA